MEKWVLAIALALLTPALTSAPLAQQEDIARVLERQTQELLNAVSAGNASVWDRYLDAKVIFLRAADGRVTGFVDRREGRDIPWVRLQ
jgi:hypothetical protein